jgi:hypothetical protein
MRGCTGHRLLIPMLALAGLAALPAPAPAAPSEKSDLNLSRRIEQGKQAAQAIANPHDFPCKDCHIQTGEEGKTVILVTGDDSIKLCLDCHPDSNLHPVRVPAANSPQGISQVWLPLGKGKLAGQIVCITCHYVHTREYRSHLLRGDDDREHERSATLCPVCHGDQLTAKSPHVKGKATCTFCHTAPPKEGQSAKGTINANVQLACNFCHGALDDAHYLSLNPFSDPCITFRPGRFGIPMLDGKFTCVSCHDPHATRETGARNFHLLRPAYLKLASLSKKVRPHWRDSLCMNCHEGQPTKGSPALRDDGDINRLCNSCHESLYARRDLHPVGVVPDDKVKVPAGWPLREGKLTCETCHDSSLQEAGERQAAVRKKNPNFLRGGYKGRNEFCFRCHLTEHYAKLNPHLQTDEWGKVREQSCLFCHSSLPDQKIAGIGNLFKPGNDLNEYCTWCHDNYTEGHPTATHLVEPSEKLLAAMESAPERLGVEFPLYEGMIICATCHNPHEAGVLASDKAASKGAGKKKRLRLNAGREMCVGCHTNR